MNALQETIDFCALETGRRDVLPVPRPLVQLMGSAEGALFVAQLLAWMESDADEAGWVTRSFEEWEAATALSTYRVRAAVRRGRRLGFLEARAGALAEKRRYRVRQAPLMRALAALLREEEPLQAGQPQTAQRRVNLPAQADPAEWQRAPSRQPARQWDERHRQPPRANGHGPATLPVQINGHLGHLGHLLGRDRRAVATPVASPALFDAGCWEAALDELAHKLPPQVYRRVLRDSRFERVEGETVVLQVPSVNAAWWVNARLARPVERAVNLVVPGKAWLGVEARVV